MKRLEALKRISELKKQYPLLGTAPKSKSILGSVIFTVFMVLIVIPAGAELALAGLIKIVDIPNMPDVSELFGIKFIDNVDPQILLIAGGAIVLLAIILIVVKFSAVKKKNKKLFDAWVDEYSSTVTDEIENEYNILQKYCTEEGDCSNCIHCNDTLQWTYDSEDADKIWNCNLHGTLREIEVGKYYYLSCEDCEWAE